MKTILLVTDNRYWRESIGSQKRIAALCRHLEQRYTLQVLFLGKLNADDVRQVADRLQGHELEAEPGLLVHRAASGEAGAPAFSARACVKQLVFEFRRGFARRAPVQRGFRRFRFQIHEPKLADYRRPVWAERFRKACARVQPDVVIIEYARVAWLLDACADALPQGCTTIVDTHDVQHLRQSSFHAEGNVHDFDITPMEEAVVLGPADAVLAIQGEDARALDELLPGKRILLVPHPQPVSPQNEPSDDGEVHLGFFGSSMAPNVDAALQLLRELWPRIKAECRNARLHVFGGVCDALKAEPEVKDVVMHGFVTDLASAYASLHVVLNPVTYGGGLKIKSVEALGYAKPLVTTAVGAQGLEAGAGQAFVLSRDDEDFVSAVLHLLRDAQARRQLAEGALEFARARFSPDHAFDELDRFIEQSITA